MRRGGRGREKGGVEGEGEGERGGGENGGNSSYARSCCHLSRPTVLKLALAEADRAWQQS